LEQDGKIEAIKIYRERTGAGLKEAKDAVDAVQRGEPLPSLPQIDDDLEKELLPLLQAGRRVQAVKAYCERTGSDLKEAARAIDGLAAQHGLATKGGGCASASMLILAAVWIAVLFLL
jgi:ribosomal protein L7/L12